MDYSIIARMLRVIFKTGLCGHACEKDPSLALARQRSTCPSASCRTCFAVAREIKVVSQLFPKKESSVCAASTHHSCSDLLLHSVQDNWIM